jgi:hypothetical protein
MRRRAKDGAEFPCWSPESGFTGEWQWQEFKRTTPRFATGYPALDRDLQQRTIEDVYRENKLGRAELRAPAKPTQQAMFERYNAWCTERGHEPHPDSISYDYRPRVRFQRLSQDAADKADAAMAGELQSAVWPVEPATAPAIADMVPCDKPCSPRKTGRKARNMAMTGEMLTAIGKALHGEFWRDPLANDLNVNERTVRRWEHNKYEMPEGVQFLVAGLIKARQEALASLLEQIGEVRAVPRPYHFSKTADGDV